MIITIEISRGLLKEAMRTARVKTEAETIAMGLQELINKARLDRLRDLRGKVEFTVNAWQTRCR